MILWTIQEEYVYRQILKTGVYRCDFKKSIMNDLKPEYDWLVNEMKIRIGNPPGGVTYPVWGWYMQDGKRIKPDLRRERWQNGSKGDKFVCLEIDVPDEEVLLSDFDVWSIILLNSLISDTEKEEQGLEEIYNSLDSAEKTAFRNENWKRVFDLTRLDNGWMKRGVNIQATFWQLRSDQIRNVRYFTGAARIR